MKILFLFFNSFTWKPKIPFKNIAEVEKEIYDSEKIYMYEHIINFPIKKYVFEIVLKYFQKQKQKVVFQETGTLACNNPRHLRHLNYDERNFI